MIDDNNNGGIATEIWALDQRSNIQVSEASDSAVTAASLGES